jgi:hypothetical protein
MVFLGSLLIGSPRMKQINEVDEPDDLGLDKLIACGQSQPRIR